MGLLLLGLLAVAGGGAAVAALRARPPPGAPPPQGEEVPAAAPPAAPPAQGPPQQRPPQGQPVPSGAKGGKTDALKAAGEAGVFAAAGAVAGLLVAPVATTKEAKEAAPLVGAGLGLAAYLSGVGGAGLSALAVVALPLLEVTFVVTVLVDLVVRAVKNGQWAELSRQVRALREKGQFREALALYRQTAPGIEPQSRVWPKPGDDWWAYDDPQKLGAPYPGFPNEPAKATGADVRRWPALLPTYVPTSQGAELDVQRVLDLAYADAKAVREYGLASGAPGVVRYAAAADTRYGRGGSSSAAAALAVTQGPRDIRAWPPYREALATAAGLARKLAGACEWLDADALVRDIRTAEEKAVDGESAQAFEAMKRAAATAYTKALGDEPTSAAAGAGGLLTPAQRAAAQRAAGEETAADRRSNPTGMKGTE